LANVREYLAVILVASRLRLTASMRRFATFRLSNNFVFAQPKRRILAHVIFNSDFPLYKFLMLY